MGIKKPQNWMPISNSQKWFKSTAKNIRNRKTSRIVVKIQKMLKFQILLSYLMGYMLSFHCLPMDRRMCTAHRGPCQLHCRYIPGQVKIGQRKYSSICPHFQKIRKKAVFHRDLFPFFRGSFDQKVYHICGRSIT